MNKRIISAVSLALAVGLTTFGATAAFADDTPAPDPTPVVTDTAASDSTPAAAPDAPAPDVTDPVVAPVIEPDVIVNTLSVKPTKTEVLSWVLPNGGTSTNVTWPQTVYDPTAEVPCGVTETIQNDTYPYGTRLEKARTDALAADGVLTQGEDYGWVISWTFTTVSGPDCAPPVTNRICDTAADGGKSTNLYADGWADIDTRSSGHHEFVSDGLHVWTDDSTSQAKVSEARIADFPLSGLGQAAIAYTATSGIQPGLNVFVNFGSGLTGTLVWEQIYGGADYWLTSGSSASITAPETGGGFGSDRHGTINEWLASYPTAQITGIAFSLGSGVLADGVIHSITLGCTTYTFGFENAPLPESHSTYTEWVDGSYACGDTTVDQTRTRVDVTYTNAPDGTVVEHDAGPATETQTRDLTGDEIAALDCPVATPTPTPSTPAAVSNVSALAQTGTDGTVAWIVVALIVLAFGALLLVAIRIRRRA